jgi:hypothetical protein
VGVDGTGFTVEIFVGGKYYIYLYIGVHAS